MNFSACLRARSGHDVAQADDLDERALRQLRQIRVRHAAAADHADATRRVRLRGGERVRRNRGAGGEHGLIEQPAVKRVGGHFGTYGVREAHPVPKLQLGNELAWERQRFASIVDGRTRVKYNTIHATACLWTIGSSGGNSVTTSTRPAPCCRAAGHWPKHCRDMSATASPARRILEVGPGTGAVTGWIVRGLKADDRFDLVELNERFVKRLRERFESEPAFQAVADRVTVFHRPVEELADERAYDAIVCGLPFNNFPAATVEHLLATMSRLAKPGGTLSFFEYVGVRPLRGFVSSRVERERLRGVGRAIANIRHGRQIRQDLILANVPPAWVHHVRFG